MAIQTDVSAVSLAASGDIYVGRTRVRGLVIEPGATAGSVVLRDGGATGRVVFTINTPAAGQVISVLIPQDGVLFQTSAYATLTNAVVTVFYG